jgi:UDP-glucose 4-epimerase
VHVLVTGGAGYVGSVVADGLLGAGHEVTVLDNLQQGHREAVPRGAQFIEADFCRPRDLDVALSRSGLDAVMHMAGETIVEYSTSDPRRYFHTNVIGGINLLDAMLRHNIKQVVFSSSAAVYGEPLTAPIEENHPKNPINSYGLTKLIFEQIMEWYGRAYGLRHISLRYFNAAGATDCLGENHSPETHLIPNVLKAALAGTPVSVFGTDYPTQDGSCIRDYVHVIDIAQAHVLALEKLDHIKTGVYNLGNGQGYSVLEVVRAAREVTGVDIEAKLSPRRAGDPAVLVASSDRAKSELGWKPKLPELQSIVQTAWTWIKSRPERHPPTPAK